jgi:hypothetical protein
MVFLLQTIHVLDSRYLSQKIKPGFDDSVGDFGSLLILKVKLRCEIFSHTYKLTINLFYNRYEITLTRYLTFFFFLLVFTNVIYRNINCEECDYSHI